MARVVIDHLLIKDEDAYVVVVADEVWGEQVDENGEVQPVLLGHANVLDYKFVASDKQWKGMTKTEIAKEQRGRVAEAERARAQAVEPPKATKMPGVGEEL
jgi:hypothetical protein